MADNKVRGFRNVGTNLFKILTILAGNKELCRLLKTTSPDIYDQSFLTNEQSLELIGKNLMFTPKIPQIEKIEGSFIVVLFEDFEIDPDNNEFVNTIITFDVLCPIDLWTTNAESLRPFLIMSEISETFNNKKLNNIGTLRLIKAERFTLSTELLGYTMFFEINDFN
jgi:hypothetical protein